MNPSLADQFGNIDIYLFDQLLRGRIVPGMTVLDCGSGNGRNLMYLMRTGFDVHAVDQEPHAIVEVQHLAAELAPHLSPHHFRTEAVEAMSFADASMDVVLSNAVLHFARDERHFRAMVQEMWRVLRPGGLLFCRLASTIGMEERFELLSGRVFRLLDESVRFLVDASLLSEVATDLGAVLLDPLKTTIVHNQRSMTTWVLRKAVDMEMPRHERG